MAPSSDEIHAMKDMEEENGGGINVLTALLIGISCVLALTLIGILIFLCHMRKKTEQLARSYSNSPLKNPYLHCAPETFKM